MTTVTTMPDTPPDARPLLDATPSQTVGPFFSIGLAHLCREQVIEPTGGAAAVAVTGRVVDGDGAPVRDAVLEIWQADGSGEYDRTGSRGFARVPTDDEGSFRFTTVRPGSLRAPGGAAQAPHLVVMLFMRGLLRPLLTRLYFPDEPANATDLVLALVPEPRRGTLIARATDATRAATGDERTVLHWDVVLQGAGETVFFEA